MFQRSLLAYQTFSAYRIVSGSSLRKPIIIVTNVLQLAATLLRTEYDFVSTSFLLSRRILLWYTLSLSDPVHHRSNTTLQKKKPT